jgi:FkbM family methyltransferase
MKMRIILAIQTLIASITKKLLGSYVYALVVKSNNGLFLVDPEDSFVSWQLRYHGRYGFDEIERLKKYINSDGRILIVGAHIGTLAIPLSKLCKEVIAIEANPNTYKLLTTNIFLNSITNCRAIEIAASNKDGNIGFLLSRVNSGGSKRVPKIKNSIYYHDNPKEISVRAVRLDDYLKEKDFHMVLMDIEGSEYFALQGMQEILSRCRLLVVEFIPHLLKNVSDVTVEQFLYTIGSSFTRMTIPSKQLEVPASEFVSHLTKMYNLGQGDDGIIFEKV